jgi:hypothetical protein
VSRTYEKQKVEQEVVIGVECDNCDVKVIGDAPSTWHCFNVNHGYYGDDSSQWLDACSPSCYIAIIKEKLLVMSSPNAEIDEMSLEFAQSLVKYVEAIE